MSSNTQVIAAVIQRDGRFLVCRRPEHKRHGNLWEFPGGKLEPDETPLQAAKRELSEELGLSVVGIGPLRLAVPDPASGFMINFIDVQAEGDPQLLEHSSLLWLTSEELLDLPLAPSDQVFARHLNSTS